MRDGEVEPFDLAEISDAPVALMSTRRNFSVREPYLPILRKGEMIKSPGEDFVLRFQYDGSLVILARGKGDYKKTIWRFSFRGIDGKPAANILFLSQDAELMAFQSKMAVRPDHVGTRVLSEDSSKSLIWSTQSGHQSTSRLWSCHGSALTLSDDGELLITCGRYFDGDVTPYAQWSNVRGIIKSQVNSVVPTSVNALYDYQIWSVID